MGGNKNAGGLTEDDGEVLKEGVVFGENKTAGGLTEDDGEVSNMSRTPSPKMSRTPGPVEDPES